MEEKNDYIPLFCRDNKSVSRKKRNDIYDEKCTAFARDFNFKTGYEKKIIFYGCTYLYESSKIPHTLLWIIHRKKKNIYIYTRNKKCLNKSTVYLYFLDFLHPFYLFDTFVSRVIVMRLKSLRPVLYCAIACCCTIVCIA